MNRGLLEVSTQVIKDLLKLPEDVKIVGVRQSWEQRDCGRFELLVEGPNLPEVYEGRPYPWVFCTVHAEFCTQDEITHIVKGEITA